MSTNYYAVVTLPTIVDEQEDRIFRFHIGKTGGGVSINATQFASWRQMREYLQHTGAKITDEYGAQLTLPELTARFEAYAPAERRRQYDWVHAAAGDSDNFQRVWAREHAGEYWLDTEGYSMCKGAFC